ncbi:XdhC/CoxI family protein [Clostridium subterminale]|uniref:XdhC/CoxI family protein n=1 Tax=Clostridium subterminale TaxID=1550 RepID=A0ABN1KH10_CLOSU
MSITLLEEVNDQIKNGNFVALSIITKACGSSPRGEGTMMGVLRDGTIIGTIGGGKIEDEIIKSSIEAIKTQKSGRYEYNLNESNKKLNMVCGGKIEVYIKVLMPKRKLIIVGGGHIALPLHFIANILGYDIVVFEDREEYCNEERFKLADELLLGDIKENLKKYPINNQCSIVIITRGHSHDYEALKTVIDTEANYIGMIGSKVKVKKTISKLLDEGLSKGLLNKVYAPIGIELGGERPEDIALAIMAEISLITNNGVLAHKKIPII